jgi:tRNA modification GTPase
MTTFAALMTGPGTGAIATIQLYGGTAESILTQIFRAVRTKPAEFRLGAILLGYLTDGLETIDQVTVGCEGSETFGIHCHGNPVIVEAVMRRLEGLGAEIITAEQLLFETLAASVGGSTIALEAKVALTRAKTIEGAKLIANQVEGGLSATMRRWQASTDSMSLHSICEEARQILRESQTARLIIEGCTIALIGPPNTGKSTLLNVLAGREKAIVTDVQGTTRDWVSAEIHIPPLAATIIDTAGLDPDLAAQEGAIAKAAQAKSEGILQQADLVLLVLDASRPATHIASRVLDRLKGKQVVVVLNKSDLPTRFDTSALPSNLRKVLYISAKQSTGIDELIASIPQALGVVDLDPHTPIAFTPRQIALLEHLSSARTLGQASGFMTALSRGSVSH